LRSLRFRTLVPAYFQVGEYQVNFCGGGSRILLKKSREGRKEKERERVKVIERERERERERTRINPRVYLVAVTFIRADTRKKVCCRKFVAS